MKINNFVFEYKGKKWCFSPDKRQILEINNILYTILQQDNISIIELTNKLLKEFPLRDIKNSLLLLENLKSSGFITENKDDYLVYDYSNLFDLKTLYYRKKTENVNKAYKDILSKGYSVCLNQISSETKKFLDIQLNDDVYYLLDFVDSYLAMWSNKCNFEYKKNYSDLYMQIKVNEERMLDELRENLERYKNIHKYMLDMKDDIKMFPCTAGLNSLYIREDGKLTPCPESEKQIDFIMNNIANNNQSVYENIVCNHCWSKFICGGFCKMRNNRKKEGCDLFQVIIELLLKLEL